MILDVAALQYLYGKNKATNKGNTVYEFSNKKPFYETVWDASGKDVFKFTNFSKNLTIDLRAGKLSTLSFDVDDLNWSDKQHGNLGIAYGCLIENVIAGSGNDMLTGNDIGNNLLGKSGNDYMWGKAGKDNIWGGAGDDFIDGGTGKNNVWGEDGNDIFKISVGKGYTTIKDFQDGMDQIKLKPGITGLKLKTKGNDVFIYRKADLMATVLNAAGKLQQNGTFLG